MWGGVTIQSVATGTVEKIEKKKCKIGVEVTEFGYLDNLNTGKIFNNNYEADKEISIEWLLFSGTVFYSMLMKTL